MRNNVCILATDFRSCDEDMKIWQKQRNKKASIHKAFEEYILCLQDSLEREKDSYKKSLIQKEIKKLKKEQKKYYVPGILEESKLDLEHKSILEGSNYSLVEKVKSEEHHSALEKSSFALVKKIRKK